MADDIALQIPLTADPNPIKQAMNEVKQSVSGAMEGIRNTMSSIRDGLGAAGVMAAGFLKSAVEEAADAQQNIADLEQTIKSTNQAAGLTAENIEDMASELQNATTFEGDDILKGQNMLLTFTNIQKDVFKDASMAMLDLSQKMKTGPEQTAIQLGKALNDPIRGVTALTRVGVTFTEEQKNQIKAMVEAGNVAGAQRVILNELNKEFGGQAQAAAKTYSGQMKQISNNIKDFKESIGNQLLPYIQKASEFIKEMTSRLSNLSPETVKIIAIVTSLTAVLGSLIGGVGLVQRIMSVLGPVISGIGTVIGGLTLPIIAVVASIALLTAAYIKNWGGIRDKTMEVINYIKPIIINGFNMVVEWFKQHWPEIKATFETVLNVIETIFNTVLMPVLQFIIEEFGVVIDWVKENWPLIQLTIQTVVNSIRENIQAALNFITAFWKEHGETIMAVVKSTWDIIKTVIDTVIHVILDILKLVMQIITGDWKGAWNTLCDIVKTIFTGVIKIISDILDNIKNIFIDMAKSAWNWGANLINGFIDGIKSKAKEVKDAIVGIVGTIKDNIGFNSPSKEGEGRYIVKWGANMISGFMDGIRSKLPEMQKLMSSTIKLPNINTSISGSSSSSSSNTIKDVEVTHKHTGEIKVKGVNNEEQTVASKEVIATELATDQNRFQFNPETWRLMK